MECFVLGTGGMMPMPRRFLTSVAVRLEGHIYLFDCGEGTQVPYKTSPLGMRSLRVIAISHLHADHVLGLPGMLMLRAQMEDPGPLIVLGPPGLDQLIAHLRADLKMYINYKIEVREWQSDTDDEVYRDEQISIVWAPVDHTVFCLGYRLAEHTQPGRFDVARATALGIAEGPLFGKLQRGQTVTLPNGQTVTPEQVLGPPRPGRSCAYITDTAVTPSMQTLMQHADIAFVESTFLEDRADDAREKKHMTVVQAAQAAQQAQVEQLVLVHFSPRYDGRHRGEFTAQASKIHPNAVAAKDGMTFEIKKR